MSPTSLCPDSPRPRLWAVALLISSVLLVGCASTGRHTVTATAPPETAPEPPAAFVPIVRAGRYTLMELVPQAAQQDLLLQVIDVAMPATLTSTVGEALRYVLLHSGYELCAPDAQVGALYALPLPAAHLQLGPLMLRDALATLAGTNWRLEVDDLARRVCFSPPATAAESPATMPAIATHGRTRPERRL